MAKTDSILVFGKYEPAPARRGGAKKAGARARPRVEPRYRVRKDGSEIDISTLEANMGVVVAQLNRILAPVESIEDWKIDKIEIDLGITGKGEIGIFGTGVGVEARAGIKLVLEKDDGEEEEEE